MIRRALPDLTVLLLTLVVVPTFADESPLAGLLEGTQFRYTRLEAGLGTVPFEETPELVRTLLQCNGDLGRVKVGIGDDGDVFVRIDLTERLLDARELSEN